MFGLGMPSTGPGQGLDGLTRISLVNIVFQRPLQMLWPGGYYSVIDLLDLAQSEKLLDPWQGFAGTGKKTDPTDRPIEPVAGGQEYISLLVVLMAEIGFAPIFQGGISRAVRMNQHPCRLVQSEEVIIFKDHLRGYHLFHFMHLGLMNLRLGFSPCPNDTFIFHALLHELVQGPKVHWEPHLEDVETLNQWALEGRLDVTKLSFHAYAKCAQHYQLLNTGAALGFGCGPLVIARQEMTSDELMSGVVAIPGELTTANFLFQLAYPRVRQRKVMAFSEIEDAVIRGQVDAGVIIHENRFTYAQKGLVKLIDLGEFWEQETGLPIPLGGIFVRRDLPLDLKLEIQKAIGMSVQYAWDHPEASTAYIRCHAQEMNAEVTRQHIQLYVNAYSADLGDTGRAAVRGMYAKAVEAGILVREPGDMFCPMHILDL